MLPAGIEVPNCVEVVLVFGVARRSAATAVRMSLEELCSTAVWWVCVPVTSKPKMAMSETAATPSARVTSTNEKANEDCERRFIGGKSSYYLQNRLFEARQRCCYRLRSMYLRRLWAWELSFRVFG